MRGIFSTGGGVKTVQSLSPALPPVRFNPAARSSVLTIDPAAFSILSGAQSATLVGSFGDSDSSNRGAASETMLASTPAMLAPPRLAHVRAAPPRMGPRVSPSAAVISAAFPLPVIPSTASWTSACVTVFCVFSSDFPNTGVKVIQPVGGIDKPGSAADDRLGSDQGEFQACDNLSGALDSLERPEYRSEYLMCQDCGALNTLAERVAQLGYGAHRALDAVDCLIVRRRETIRDNFAHALPGERQVHRGSGLGVRIKDRVLGRLWYSGKIDRWLGIGVKDRVLDRLWYSGEIDRWLGIDVADETAYRSVAFRQWLPGEWVSRRVSREWIDVRYAGECSASGAGRRVAACWVGRKIASGRGGGCMRAGCRLTGYLGCCNDECKRSGGPGVSCIRVVICRLDCVRSRGQAAVQCHRRLAFGVWMLSVLGTVHGDRDECLGRRRPQGGGDHDAFAYLRIRWGPGDGEACQRYEPLELCNIDLGVVEIEVIVDGEYRNSCIVTVAGTDYDIPQLVFRIMPANCCNVAGYAQ